MNKYFAAVPASLAALFAFFAGTSPALAQGRIKDMPGYEQFARVGPQINGSVRLAAPNVTWSADGTGIDFTKDTKRFHYDFASQKTTELSDGAATATGRGGRGGGAAGNAAGGRGRGVRGGPPGVERGRQAASATSPDGKLRASYRDRNLYLSDASGANEIPLTTNGNEKDRTKFGVASWVYGEELGQRTAMWWSPDSSKLAYYGFDESKVPDYYLQMNQTGQHDALDIEAFPNPGDPNPVAEIYVYDLKTKKTTKLDVRDGKPFDNAVVGHYVYHVQWSPDGSELLFNRTNRRQNIMELAAANPDTGKCRPIVHEEWPTGWVVNSPTMQFLADGKRFIWASERTGWRNYYLYNLQGQLLSTLTNHEYDSADIERVDEKAGLFYYMSRDGDNHMKLQLHRAGLDGKGDTRLTDPAFLHTVAFSPDGKYFVDTAQTHDTPPVARLMNAEGKQLLELATSDMSRFNQLGLKKVELITFKAADEQTDLQGLLSFPSNFDPTRKYPMLVSVYGGPNTNAAHETFSLPNNLAEYGFLVAVFDSRSASGRGKEFIDSIYLKLGRTEVDDQAAGVKSLYNRPYLDKTRVGMFGTSYGGTVSATVMVRYPDVFAAASSSSPVTDYRLYDTIYAERYMWIPQENKEGFDAAAIMTYAANLKGRLLLYYGTADNNVHPTNMMQLITALQRAGKSFDVQVGPDQGHSGVNQQRMMEFFIDNLVLAPKTSVAP